MRKKSENVYRGKEKVYKDWVVESFKCAYRMKFISSDAEAIRSKLIKKGMDELKIYI